MGCTGIPEVGQLPREQYRAVQVYRKVQGYIGIPRVEQKSTGLCCYIRGRAAAMQNSTVLYRQPPSKAIQGCTGVPGIMQLPRRTIQGCTGIPVVGQLQRRTVQGCAGIPVVG